MTLLLTRNVQSYQKVFRTTTRNVQERKYNFPRYYLFGLNLDIHCKLFHLFLLILGGDDVANIHSYNSLFAGRMKSIHKESNILVCNLQCS